MQRSERMRPTFFALHIPATASVRLQALFSTKAIVFARNSQHFRRRAKSNGFKPAESYTGCLAGQP
jgi:hypothetical protein